MGLIYKDESSTSRKIKGKIWEYSLHTFKREPGKKKDINDYQFKSCMFCKSAGLLTSIRKSWNEVI